MSGYPMLVALHAVIAVLGAGLLTALALTAQKPLILPIRITLALLLLTGIGADFAAGGAWHAMTWFRVSVLLFVVTGVLLFRAQKAVAPQTVKALAWTMCGAIAIITALMELKPV